jgi:hypothetical protein
VAMKPEEFFTWFVEPAIGDCFLYSGEIRLSLTAAATLVDCADHCFTFTRRTDAERTAGFDGLAAFFDFLSVRSGGAFRDAINLAAVYKNLRDGSADVIEVAYGTPSRRMDSLHIGAGEIVSLEAAFVEENKTHDDPFLVFLTRRDGRRGEVITLLCAARDALASFMRIPRAGKTSPSLRAVT